MRNIDGFHIGDRHGLEVGEGRKDIFPGRVLHVRAEERVQAIVVQKIGIAVGGMDGVDPDKSRGEVQSQFLDA
jgi:hypothetical protein